MNKGVEAFPLQWPHGWKKTDGWRRQEARFKTAFAKARDELMSELRLMGARLPVLSTNIPLRKDGLPYADFRQPEDPGVAVYFELKGKGMVFACDRYRKVTDNIQAVRLTIEALRGIQRWGASDMLERAFSGFAALPAPDSEPHWSQILGVSGSSGLDQIEDAYRSKAKQAHPDLGGSAEAMQRLNRAVEQARSERHA